jgi:hypothetical protein
LLHRCGFDAAASCDFDANSTSERTKKTSILIFPEEKKWNMAKAKKQKSAKGGTKGKNKASDGKTEKAPRSSTGKNKKRVMDLTTDDDNKFRNSLEFGEFLMVKITSEFSLSLVLVLQTAWR